MPTQTPVAAHTSVAPPIVLTFLAPADRCNQRCPACIIDRLGEPVSDLTLTPDDYTLIVDELLADGVPLLGINFQGYEVTLPRSWPYVEAVFALAKQRGIRRSFITNGMLLDRWTDRIAVLDPHRIAVSLDGADAETNDPIRGVQGAFLATTRSLERFLGRLPQFAPRVAIASTLFSEANCRSLLAMPRLLSRFGIPKWAVTAEGDFIDGRHAPVQTVATLGRWLTALRSAADDEGIRLQFNDEFGFFNEPGGKTGSLTQGTNLFDPDFIVRVDPSGYLRVGRELITVWHPEERRRWYPGRRSATEVIGYSDLVRRTELNRAGDEAPRLQSASVGTTRHA